MLITTCTCNICCELDTHDPLNSTLNLNSDNISERLHRHQLFNSPQHWHSNISLHHQYDSSLRNDLRRAAQLRVMHQSCQYLPIQTRRYALNHIRPTRNPLTDQRPRHPQSICRPLISTHLRYRQRRPLRHCSRNTRHWPRCHLTRLWTSRERGGVHSRNAR